jgi:hypothetical protein
MVVHDQAVQRTTGGQTAVQHSRLCQPGSGVYGRSALKERIDAGLLHSWQVDYPGAVPSVLPNLVGDAAFPLRLHLQKVRKHLEDPLGQRAFSRRGINCRRLIEIAFGRLKA